MSNNITKNLKKIMKEKKLTQNNLAEILGIKQAQISFWLNGKRNPTMTTLEKIAKALNVSVTDLLNDNEKNSDIKNSNRKIANKQDIHDNNNLYTERIKLLEKENAMLEKQIVFLEEQIEFYKKSKK